MDSLLSSSTPVHFYDTDRHLILCGVRGFADRRAAAHDVRAAFATDPHRDSLA